MDNMNNPGKNDPIKELQYQLIYLLFNTRAVYRLVLVCCLIGLFERNVQSI